MSDRLFTGSVECDSHNSPARRSAQLDKRGEGSDLRHPPSTSPPAKGRQPKTRIVSLVSTSPHWPKPWTNRAERPNTWPSQSMAAAPSEKETMVCPTFTLTSRSQALAKGNPDRAGYEATGKRSPVGHPTDGPFGLHERGRLFGASAATSGGGSLRRQPKGALPGGGPATSCP
jgi:hypothetical protein